MPEVVFKGKGSKVVMDTRPLDKLVKKAPEKGDRAVRKTAFQIETDAKILAAVDTGAMRSSVHTVTSKGSNASTNLALAQGLRPGVEVAEAPPVTRLGLAYVGVGVEYGIFVEFGTYKTSAQPFIVPAVEMNERTLVLNIIQEVLTP